jgi:hypothetical protein
VRECHSPYPHVARAERKGAAVKSGSGLGGRRTRIVIVGRRRRDGVAIVAPPAFAPLVTPPAASVLGLVLLAAALLVLAFSSLALGACGGPPTDKNEPNDDLNSATVLKPGEPAQGVIGPGDSDVFRCDTPEGDVSHAFTVTVHTAAPQDIELQVGASIPGVWEGITWPGWEAVAKGDSLELAGTLRKGTILMFLKGSADTEYSIDIAWE